MGDKYDDFIVFLSAYIVIECAQVLQPKRAYHEAGDLSSFRKFFSQNRHIKSL